MDRTKEPSDTAALAKAALRRLALAKLEPTPANYARAWREEGGPAVAESPVEPTTAVARQAVQALAARLAPAGALRDRLAQAVSRQQWRELGQLIETELPSPAAQAQAWAEAIDRSGRQLERGTKAWPVGRRKESLRHVLSASRTDPQRLLERLQGLLGSWDGGDDVAVEDAAEVAVDLPSVPLSPAVAAAVAAAVTDISNEAAVRMPAQELPAADPVQRAEAVLAAAIDEVAQAVAGPRATAESTGPQLWPQVVQVFEHTLQAALPPGEPRSGQLGAGLGRVVAGLVVGADGPAAEHLDDLQRACAEVRRVLQHRHHLVDQLGGLVRELTDGLGELAEDDSWVEGQCVAMREQIDQGLTSRGVSAVSTLLASTRQRQQQLRGERAQARDALKQLIHRMLQDIGELGTHTGRFQDSVGRYAEVIGRADSLEGLAGVVREMVDETRTVHALVSQTTQRLHEEHAQAEAMAGRVRELEQELRQLSQEVCTDQLTQIANRRGLLRVFEVERSRVEREAATLAIGLLDIDNFKRLNDTLGHNTGDEALKFLARRVGEALRPTDTLARYGGEEFVVLLPGTPIDEAQRVLTRVQRLLSAELFMHEDKQSFVTFSAGVTLYRQGEPFEGALQRADEALYEAKRTGKNRTCQA